MLNLKNKMRVVMFATKHVVDIYQHYEPNDYNVGRLCNMGCNIVSEKDMSVYYIASIMQDAVESKLRSTSAVEIEAVDIVIRNVDLIDIIRCDIYNSIMGIAPLDIYSDKYNEAIRLCIQRCINIGVDADMIEDYAANLRNTEEFYSEIRN